MDAAMSLQGIEEAASVVDPVFLDSPQFDCEPLSRLLGVSLVLKVECLNPIRSFKGRGTDYLLRKLPADGRPIVCASAGNFGQGMAYACRTAARRLTVFAAKGASAVKVERMRALGAQVMVGGADFDEAKLAAKQHAAERGLLYVEDGRLGPIAEGAGTIARELTARGDRFDAVFIPLGNGSLVNGMALWLKHAAPAARVVAVCAASAPAMELSWREGRPVNAPSATIADGIAVRIPIPEALALMRGLVDEVMLVTEAEIVTAMRMLFTEAGVLAEPAAVAGLAAIAQRKTDLAGSRIATPITGSNLGASQIREWVV